MTGEKHMKHLDYLIVGADVAKKVWARDKGALTSLAASLDVSVDFLVGKMDKYQIEVWPYAWVADSLKEGKKVKARVRYEQSEEEEKQPA